MPSYRYLDTSVVVSWCCANSPSPEARDVSRAKAIDGFLADPATTLGVSELTIVELYDALAKRWRMSEHPGFDETSVRSALEKLLGVVASGRCTVVRTPPRVTEHAMILVTLAARSHGVSFKAWDATHLVTASTWAHRVDAKVMMVTSDDDFSKFLGLFSYFENWIELDLLT